MSFSLTAGDRKLLLVAGGVSLLMTIVAVVLASGGETTEEATTYSVGSGGAKAAYLLLNASGYSVRRWEVSARELPHDVTATLVFADPQGTPTPAERDAIEEFIERGGRVIATGVTGSFFLPVHQAFRDPIAGATWARLPSRSPSRVTRAAPEITLAPQAYWASESFVLPLYGDGDRARVIKYDHGQGEVLWWASATPLTNAGMREPGNLEFFLASLGDPKRPILWDEYFHGHRPAAPSSLAAAPLEWIAVQLSLLTAAVLLTYSRRSGPVIEPVRDSRLSPLEFVRTLGSLYQRAGAASVAVDIAFQRFRYQLTRRLGKPANALPDDLDREVRERFKIDDPDFGRLLRSCEAARHDHSLAPDAALALTRSLAGYAAKLGVSKET
jgi:Domain of unknown function (DUF4350)